ncbi:MAG: type II toxin-antitoxin system RelE/ParE family toxin [Campylobacteraceae bacterium]|nr:type II toxin-antitoxin system RelE/ParE family toxin [Campylobacteraceae bacterium]
MKTEKTKPFQKWFDSIKDKILKVAVRQKIERIEKDGYLGKTSPIGDGISEIKFKMGAGYRIYFNLYIEGSEVWLLSGGDKSTQQKDIDAAKELLKEIQEKREAKKDEQI